MRFHNVNPWGELSCMRKFPFQFPLLNAAMSSKNQMARIRSGCDQSQMSFMMLNERRKG